MIDMDYLSKHHTNTYAGCRKYADEAGWDCTINPFVDRELASCNGTSPYDGVVGRITPSMLAEGRRLGIPMVNVWMGSPVSKEVPSVFPDFGSVGAMGAAHLRGRGVRSFGFLGFSAELPSRHILRRFRATIKKMKAEYPCTVLRIERNDPLKGRNWAEFRARMGKWVDTWTLPIGVIVAHDLPCRYLADICQSKGIGVPYDLATVSMNNEEAICSSSPSLTSIDLGYEKIGYEASVILGRLMDGQAPPSEPLLIQPKKLVSRQSTDSFSVEDPLVELALRFIAEHAHEGIQVGDVGKVAPISLRSLHRRFSEVMQRSIGAEIVRFKLERAKRRLLSSGQSLEKIAIDSGFSSVNHFARAFVRVEKIPPGAFREINGGKKASSRDPKLS
jgi:LacI family transcriptional regulator